MDPVSGELSCWSFLPWNSTSQFDPDLLWCQATPSVLYSYSGRAAKGVNALCWIYVMMHLQIWLRVGLNRPHLQCIYCMSLFIMHIFPLELHWIMWAGVSSSFKHIGHLGSSVYLIWCRRLLWEKPPDAWFVVHVWVWYSCIYEVSMWGWFCMSPRRCDQIHPCGTAMCCRSDVLCFVHTQNTVEDMCLRCFLDIDRHPDCLGMHCAVSFQCMHVGFL